MQHFARYTLVLFLSLLLTSPFCFARGAGRREGAAAVEVSTQTPTTPPLPATQNAPGISFVVSMPEPHTHMLDVEMRVRFESGEPPAQVRLVMPVWTPGSYLVREFARNVQDFDARNGAQAQTPPLRWEKAEKNIWRIETGGARELRVSYRVYANELSVRTNEVNDRHAFWNNAGLLMYVEGALRAPATVRVVPFKDWKIATGLPRAEGGEPNTFRAENFDVLYDSPFLVSDFKTISFEVRGVPHRVVIDGEGNYDAERVRRDVQKIVETAVELMGGEVPYRDYTFLLMLHPFAGGGLEHLNSTALLFRRFNFRPDKEYQGFLTLVAHEYFHHWNVKRIRPDALGPFDYTRENYTKLLWVAEGGTDYYERVLVRRAGLMSDKDFLEATAKSMQSLQETPGRHEQSVEESSFDAWIKYYRRDENSVNSQVAYYEKGALLSLLLDLEIRRRTSGARSLDDVMRYLYNEYAKKNRNYTPEDFQRAVELAAGGSLEDFFRRYVRGREELDYDRALEAVGLRLDTAGESVAGRASEKAYLGATLARADEQVAVTTSPASGFFRTSLPPDAAVIKTVLADTPAYNAGLNVGDQIVALDGLRATRESFDKRLEEKRPGDTVTLTIFRLDELRTFTVKLGGKSTAPYRILALAQATPEQQKLYTGWLGAPFPSAASGNTR